MSGLLSKIPGLLLFVLFTSASIVWQFHQITDLEKQTAHDAQQLNQYAATVTLLAENANKQQHNQQQLATQTNQLQQQLQQRQQLIRTLHNENKEYKKWADIQLPAAVKRLRHRPSFTGAADYQQFLSDADTVQPAGDPTDTKR